MDSLLLIFLMSSMCTMSNLALDRNDSGTGIAILVRRRNIDMVEYFQNNQRKACNEDSNYGTYLVVEDQCIENMYLFNGKMNLDLTWPNYMNYCTTHLYRVLLCNNSKVYFIHHEWSTNSHRGETENKSYYTDLHEHKSTSKQLFLPHC